MAIEKPPYISRAHLLSVEVVEVVASCEKPEKLPPHIDGLHAGFNSKGPPSVSPRCLVLGRQRHSQHNPGNNRMYDFWYYFWAALLVAFHPAGGLTLVHVRAISLVESRNEKVPLHWVEKRCHITFEFGREKVGR